VHGEVGYGIFGRLYNRGPLHYRGRLHYPGPDQFRPAFQVRKHATGGGFIAAAGGKLPKLAFRQASSALEWPVDS